MTEPSVDSDGTIHIPVYTQISGVFVVGEETMKPGDEHYDEALKAITDPEPAPPLRPYDSS
jgi:hypothetical protein